MLALAAGALSLGLATPTLAQDPDPIEYQFLRPGAPGDAFSLRFTVPDGLVPAVLITNRTNAEPTDDESWDGTSTMFLPLPVDPSGTFTGLDGVLPEGVTLEELQNSIVDFRILLLDPLTESFLLSEPLPLQSPPVGEESVEEPSTEGESDEDALTAQDMNPSGAGGSSASSGGDQETEHVSEEDGTDASNPNPKTGSYSIGWNLIPNTPLAILALGNISSAALLSIYDQPTPVQGSGH
ncbi:MAG: hypothetical protein ACF8XB_02180 [Planctomycetota bacterium JB042]